MGRRMGDSIFALWGKASPNQDGGPRFHPLVYHCLDVAAVFEALLHRRRFSVPLRSLLGSPPYRFDPVLVALVGLHDIAKACIRFQAKAPHVWPASLYEVYPGSQAAFDHAAAADAILADRLREVLEPFWPDWRIASRNALIAAIAYHHGRPVDRAGANVSREHAGRLAVTELAAINDAASAILSAFDKDPQPLPKLESNEVKQLSWVLSGMVTLADWIGSSQMFFPYVEPTYSPSEYLTNCARPHARDALRTIGLEDARIAPKTGLAALTDAAFAPSPAQRFAETTTLPNAPSLLLLEDMTGSGKTEAALVLAHRMMRAGLGDSLYVALPTMATANAMFERMRAVYRRMFAEDAKPSLVLAHGASALNEAFALSIVKFGADEPDYGDGEDETGSSACCAFFADDRRKAFFAEVGVGTIDQAILSVLPTKHATMRQAGLARSILIVDEAHAYDAYVAREIERLLAFHAEVGGSAIILSATLPARMKRAYARALCGGKDPFAAQPARTDYPLASVVTKDASLAQHTFALRDGLARSVKVRRLGSSEDALEEVRVAAAKGAAIAYIRNTVDDAREVFQALAASGMQLAPMLYHARFAMCDRLEIENEVLNVFGPPRTAKGDRRGRVLVATQVAEQSLDLDFDLIVTDLAPIDLVIQRAGRLWRHERPERPLKTCELSVVSPEPVADADAQWFGRSFPRGRYVYRDASRLWLSAKALFEAGEIRSPDGIRPLVERVYGPPDRDVVPPDLRYAFDQGEGRMYGEQSLADLNLLELATGYNRVSGEQKGGWSNDMLTPTRLGEEATLARLALWVGGELKPYAADADQQRAWAMSEVRVRRSLLAWRGDYDVAIEQAARRLEEQWEKRGDRALVLPLLGEEPRRAFAMREGGREKIQEPIALIYDRASGLRRGTE